MTSVLKSESPSTPKSEPMIQSLVPISLFEMSCALYMKTGEPHAHCNIEDQFQDLKISPQDIESRTLRAFRDTIRTLLAAFWKRQDPSPCPIFDNRVIPRLQKTHADETVLRERGSDHCLQLLSRFNTVLTPTHLEWPEITNILSSFDSLTQAQSFRPTLQKTRIALRTFLTEASPDPSPLTQGDSLFGWLISGFLFYYHQGMLQHPPIAALLRPLEAETPNSILKARFQRQQDEHNRRRRQVTVQTKNRSIQHLQNEEWNRALTLLNNLKTRKETARKRDRRRCTRKHSSRSLITILLQFRKARRNFEQTFGDLTRNLDTWFQRFLPQKSPGDSIQVLPKHPTHNSATSGFTEESSAPFWTDEDSSNAHIIELPSDSDEARRQSWNSSPEDNRPGMVRISGGSFLMGGGNNENNSTEHRIILAPYFLDRMPVTNAQYQKFVHQTGHRVPFIKAAWAKPYNWRMGSYPRGKADFPVLLVNWFDAQAYAEWSEKRLPTEAEWERAARGLDGRTFPWGEQPDTDRGNFKRTHEGPVATGLYPSGISPAGCLDLVGNHWEWCADWYDPNYYASSPRKNPQGPSRGTQRILRGGAWDSTDEAIRSDFRFHASPHQAHFYLGFRCAADLT